MKSRKVVKTIDSKFISISEYAKSKGVSTQAVYKQLKSHESKLQGLIITASGKRWLSPDAVKILDAASKSSPIVLVDEADKIKLEEAEQRIRDLEEQLQIVQNKVLTAQETIISLQQSKIDYITIHERSKLLLEQKETEIQNLKNRSLWRRLFNFKERFL
jgi:hypothetical protein